MLHKMLHKVIPACGFMACGFMALALLLPAMAGSLFKSEAVSGVFLFLSGVFLVLMVMLIIIDVSRD